MDTDSAEEGETVTVSPKDGYTFITPNTRSVVTYLVVTSEDVELTLDTENNVYTFEMPAKAVSLTVSEWQEPEPEKYAVTITDTAQVGLDPVIEQGGYEAGDSVEIDLGLQLNGYDPNNIDNENEMIFNVSPTGLNYTINYGGWNEEGEGEPEEINATVSFTMPSEAVSLTSVVGANPNYAPSYSVNIDGSEYMTFESDSGLYAGDKFYYTLNSGAYVQTLQGQTSGNTITPVQSDNVSYDWMFTMPAEDVDMTVVSDSQEPKFISIYPQDSNGASDMPAPIAGKYTLTDFDPVTTEDELDIGFVNQMKAIFEGTNTIECTLNGQSYSINIDEEYDVETGELISFVLKKYDENEGEEELLTISSMIPDGESDEVWVLTPNSETLSSDDVLYLYFNAGTSYVDETPIMDEFDTQIGTTLALDGVSQSNSYLDLTAQEYNFQTLQYFAIDENDLTDTVYFDANGDGGYNITDGTTTYAIISNIGPGESDFNYIIAPSDGDEHYIGLSVADVQPEVPVP